MSKHTTSHTGHHGNHAEVIDPVCGMSVATDAGKPTIEHMGHTHYFCSTHCRDKFAAAPERYEAKYTCPMHPEVVAEAPGCCSKCGMALTMQRAAH